MVSGQSHRGRRKFLAVVPKVLPELRPALFRWAANVNVRMVLRLFVLDPVWIPSMTGQPARFEVLIHVLSAESNYDDRLRRRIAIAAIPEGINAADCAWQPVFRAVKVDSASLAIIGADDAELRPFLRRQ